MWGRRRKLVTPQHPSAIPGGRSFDTSVASKLTFRSSIEMSGSSTLVELPPLERRAELLESLTEIRTRVQACALPNSTPTLVAVSKYKPASDILACYHEGRHLDFGENYVQELEGKAHILPLDIRWHFIGTLQSNKAKTLAAIPNLYSIQTLNSVKAANALNKALPAQRTTSLRVLIQVNTSSEDAKSGLSPLTIASNLEQSELIKLAKFVVAECPKLRLEGLMTIGSLEQSVAVSEVNADFERLKETKDVLASYLKRTFGETEGDDKRWGDESSGNLLLSMGMSSDFEAALKSGGDIVRVGTGIFGRRPAKTT